MRLGGTLGGTHAGLLTMMYVLCVAYQPARYMVVLGLYHGLLVLPVMLSLVKPASIAGIIANPKHAPKPSTAVAAITLIPPKP